MSGQFWLSVAAYVLPTFPLGYVWHLTLFKKAYEGLDAYRREMIIPLGMASMLIQGAVYSWLYPRLFDTAHDAWFSSASRFAVMFGLVAWTYSTLAVSAKHKMNSPARYFRLETAFTVIHFAVVSPLMALVWRQGS